VSTRAFYTSTSGSYNEIKDSIGDPEAGKSYALGHKWLGVVNDVFNGVGTSSLIAYHVALGQQYDTVLSSHVAL
jgi:hypothetical protein